MSVLGIGIFFAMVTKVNPDMLATGCSVAALALGLYDVRFILVGWYMIAPYFFPYPVEEHAGAFSVGPNVSHYQFIPLFLLIYVVRSHLSGKKFSIGKEELFLVGFAVYSAVSSMVATQGLYKDVRSVYVNYGLGLVVYVLAKNIDLDRRLLKALGLAALFHVVALTFIGIYEYKTGLSFYYIEYLRFDDVGYGRISGPFVQPIVLGTFLPINFLFIYQAHKLGLLPRFAVWIGGALTGLLIVLTFTRSVWLGAFAAILYVIYKGSDEGAAKVVRLAGFAVVAIGLVVFLALSSPEINQRLTGRENTDFRLAMAHVSLNMFLDKPLFGWGMGTFDQYKEQYLMDAYGFYMTTTETSHVTLLTFLAELGIAGTILLLIFVYRSVAFKGVYMREFTSDARLVAAVSVGAILSFLINAFLVDMRFFALMWAYFFMSLGFIHNIYRTHIITQRERQNVQLWQRP
jgi:O-antigen ligase